MKTPLTALALVLGLASAALAQEAGQLPDDQLLGEVVTATEARNKERLLELMLEVQSRRLLMFKSDDAVCDAFVPKVGVLENMLAFGNARQAYIVAARQAAMDNGECGCPFETLSFREFVRVRAGQDAKDIDQKGLRQLLDYARDNQSRVDDSYRRFRRDSCGKS